METTVDPVVKVQRPEFGQGIRISWFKHLIVKLRVLHLFLQVSVCLEYVFIPIVNTRLRGDIFLLLLLLLLCRLRRQFRNRIQT
jgi:hypothetical protein